MRQTRVHAGAEWNSHLSVIAAVAFFIMLDGLDIVHAAGRAPRCCTGSLLDDLMPAGVLVYDFCTHSEQCASKETVGLILDQEAGRLPVMGVSGI